jgi:hypothetical protein
MRRLKYPNTVQYLISYIWHTTGCILWRLVICFLISAFLGIHYFILWSWGFKCYCPCPVSCADSFPNSPYPLDPLMSLPAPPLCSVFVQCFSRCVFDTRCDLQECNHLLQSLQRKSTVQMFLACSTKFILPFPLIHSFWNFVFNKVYFETYSMYLFREPVGFSTFATVLDSVINNTVITRFIPMQLRH